MQGHIQEYTAVCVSVDTSWKSSEAEDLCGGRPFLPIAHVILSLAAICGWVRFVTHAAKSHKKFGPLLVIMRKMITNDVSRYLVIQISLLCAFSTALLGVSTIYGQERVLDPPHFLFLLTRLACAF